MLQAVRNPQGKWIRFEYDALGRRTAKIVNTKIYRYLWDGNAILHEWFYENERRPKVVSDELGMLMLEQPEPVENLTTWVYEEGSLVPTAKLCEGKSYSIVSDYLGRPAQAYDDKGELVWQVEFDIYGRIRENLFNNKSFIPFRQLGQYEDKELDGLYYNRFRYYDSNTGIYISLDPIGLDGGMVLYNYVHDANNCVDPFGLTGTYMFTDGTDWYIGKGAKGRMYASMIQRVGSIANVTQGIHVDFGDSKTGFMVEAELIRRNNAVKDPTFKNIINSPGKKLLKDAELNNKPLYDDIIKKADDFETKFNNQKGKGIKCH